MSDEVPRDHISFSDPALSCFADICLLAAQVIPALGVGVTSVDETERLKMVQVFGRLVVAAAHFLTTDDDWAVFLQV